MKNSRKKGTMNTIFRTIIALIVLSVFMTGCGDSETPQPDQDTPKAASPPSIITTAPSPLPATAAAVVNGYEITVTDLRERLHRAIHQSGGSPEIDEYTLTQLRENALQELIKIRLIAQKAEEFHLTISDEEFHHRVQQVQQEYGGTDIHDILQEQGQTYEAWASEQRHALLLEKLVDLNMSSMITVSSEEIQQYYERHEEEYDHPDQVRAYQILTYKEGVAQQALQEIRNGVDFAEAAKRYSESPDAETGGDLGFFGQGVMPAEFDRVLASLEIGGVSDVIKTPYGYQIFKLVGRRNAHRLSFEEAKPHIEQKLKAQKRTFAIDLWMAELQERAKIELNHKAITLVK